MDRQEHTQEFSVVMSLNIGRVTMDIADIKQFYFIEDIFSFAMVGKMIFTDSRGLFEFGPLTGNERISILYGEEEDRIITFNIYKVSKVDQMSSVTSNIEAIEIFFAEEMFFNINFSQFSRSWKDTRLSDIVRDIGNNFLNVQKWNEWEESENKLDYFYIPYWNINTTMSWLLKHGIGNNSKEPGYCFYNNTKGTNFVTLEKLLSDNELMLIHGEDEGLYVLTDVNPFLYNKILHWSISGIDQSVYKQISGGVKRGYDSKTKSFIQKEFKYSDSIKKQTILGKKSLFPDISNTKVSYQTTGEADIQSIDTIYHNNWNKRYAHQQCTSFVVRGHEKRYCGGIIEVEWPSGDEEEHYNKHLHGLYLIKSITHVFNGHKKPAYQQKMVCIKNGYGNSNVADLVKSTKFRL